MIKRMLLAVILAAALGVESFAAQPNNNNPSKNNQSNNNDPSNNNSSLNNNNIFSNSNNGNPVRAVPEPSTWLLMGIGMGAIAWRLRKKR